jgi:uncharacterized BrkB/YihY/UPF0761 family membrane protein
MTATYVIIAIALYATLPRIKPTRTRLYASTALVALAGWLITHG